MHARGWLQALAPKGGCQLLAAAGPQVRLSFSDQPARKRVLLKGDQTTKTIERKAKMGLTEGGYIARTPAKLIGEGNVKQRWARP